MRKLDTKLRFNAKIREEFADRILSEKFKEMIDQNNSLIEKVTNDLLECYWEHLGCDRKYSEDAPEGILPRMGAVTLYSSDNVSHTFNLPKPVPVPFCVYVDAKAVYNNAVTGTLQTDIDQAIESNFELENRLGSSRNALLTNISKYASPAKLAEKAPELMTFMPDDWFVEDDEEEATLDDFLQTEAA